jgi:hypothetical protein
MSHVLCFISICDIFTDSSSYMWVGVGDISQHFHDLDCVVLMVCSLMNNEFVNI